jgi:hypothetical protein
MMMVVVALSGAVAAVVVGAGVAVGAGSEVVMVRSLIVSGPIIVAILGVAGEVVMAGRRVMVMVMGLALRLVISCVMALFAMRREACLMNNGWMSFLGRWCRAGVRVMMHFLVIISFIMFGPFHFFLPPCLCPLIFLPRLGPNNF